MSTHFARSTLAILILAALSACGGGSPGSAPETGVTNTAPVSDAGPEQIVTSGDVVTLDGSGSFDPDGDNGTYIWTLQA